MKRCFNLAKQALWTAVVAQLCQHAVAAADASTFLLAGDDPLAGWVTKSGTPAEWTIGDDYVEVVPGSGDIFTEQQFGQELRLHLEFWLPSEPEKSGQHRANSGLFILGRYEIQILDSLDNPTYADGVCGALYKQIAPRVIACKPAEQWQSLDIEFHAPRVDGAGRVRVPGMLTVRLNGITVIDHQPFLRPTGSAGNMPQGIPGPMRLQDHGSGVRFRNFWVMPVDSLP